MSTQLIKPNYLVILPPTQHHSFFRNLPPLLARSGFLNLPFDTGDSVMADKGFTVEDLLPLGVSLNIPPFLEVRSKSALRKWLRQSIAFLCIHVERGINKIKNFHISDSIVPFTMFGVVNQMWSVCAMLCNFQNSIISEKLLNPYTPRIKPCVTSQTLVL